MGVLTRWSALVAGALPGAALGAAALIVALVRRDKPLHPVGHHGSGSLLVTEPKPALGIKTLAHPGSQPCTVRWSRSMGLPLHLPDIEGMALRLPDGGTDGKVADVLFASTGSQAWSRYLMVLRGPGRFGRLTSLLPVRAAGRAVTFMIVPDDEPVGDLPPAAYTLHAAQGTEDWVQVGQIDVAWSESDSSERFDPVTNQLAGIEQYPFVTALREPAYATARMVTSAGRAARRGRAVAHRARRPAPGANQ